METSWDEVCLLRARLYHMLGHCLLEPPQKDQTFLTRAFWDGFPLEAANQRMQSGLDRLTAVTKQLTGEKSASFGLETMQMEYTTLFIGPGRPKAPAWESFYRTPEPVLFGQYTYEIRGVMERIGLESRFKNRQPEDHMGMELLLLSATSEDMIRLGDAGRTKAARWQMDFITQHPLQWIGDFLRDVDAHGTTGFYAGWVELVWGILLWDLELLQELMETA